MTTPDPGDDDQRWQSAVAPPGHVNPRPQARYNLVVIGAGPAGLVAAIAAAGLGARVALVEREAMGGDCLNVGCVPSKALLHASRRAIEHGFDGEAAFQQAIKWVRGVRADIAAHDSVARYREAGVDVFLGAGRIVDGRTVSVEGAMLRTRAIVIATGARAAIPAIPGLADVGALTNETLFALPSLPSSMVILGAGAIGCEMAQAFARMGTRVTLVETMPRVLSREDPEAAQIVQRALERSGVEVITGVGVVAFSPDPSGVRVTLANGQTVTASRVVVAAGRRPNTEGLGLREAGIKTTDRGQVVVDARLETTCPGVYAIGDVASDLQFTHHADAQARLVVQNALFMGRKRADALIIPWVTYTTPELARVGLNVAGARAAGVKVDAYRVRWTELDRGRTDDVGDGYAEVLVREGTDKMVGATLVGPDAGELLAPILVMMNAGQGLGALASAVLPYPTRSEYLKRLSDRYRRTRLTPRVASWLRRWLALRR